MWQTHKKMEKIILVDGPEVTLQPCKPSIASISLYTCLKYHSVFSVVLYGLIHHLS